MLVGFFGEFFNDPEIYAKSTRDEYQQRPDAYLSGKKTI